ncbi:MAG: hypothetical protein JXA11_10920 [Phycisphaerae bacterium]|nr:hypothetical protein [Phycisphaerae bacterium]
MPESQVHDSKALVSAKRVAVMPVVRPEGIADGGGQAGVLMTELAGMDYYDVEGVGRFRRALKKQQGQSDLTTQQTVAEELGIDALGVCEVTDYRWTTKTKGNAYFTQTQCTYHVALQIRLISLDGKVLYTGKGAASSQKGYGPATLEATRKATRLLKDLIDKIKREKKEARSA